MSIYAAAIRRTLLPFFLRRENRQSSLPHWRFFEKSQFWPRQKLLDYQWDRLSQLIIYSYENVPYYKQVFDERGLQPGDIKGFDDLTKLPILTRDDIFKQGDRILSARYDKSVLQEFTTGGTTGSP